MAYKFSLYQRRSNNIVHGVVEQFVWSGTLFTCQMAFHVASKLLVIEISLIEGWWHLQLRSYDDKQHYNVPRVTPWPCPLLLLVTAAIVCGQWAESMATALWEPRPASPSTSLGSFVINFKGSVSFPQASRLHLCFQVSSVQFTSRKSLKVLQNWSKSSKWASI